MKRHFFRLSCAVLSIYLSAFAVFAQELIPVGQIIGLELSAGTVTVAAFDDSLTVARDSGLQVGDQILTIDEASIACAEDVRRALKHSDGAVEMVISRNGKQQQIHMEPEITSTGPKLGIYLKQGITGIGTVTYYDPETGNFGTLGHGVNDSRGDLLPMTRGNAYPASIVSVQKGKSGTPGQLKGALKSDRLLGSLTCNTSRGVFGKVSTGWQGKAVPMADADAVHLGPASIRSTVDSHGPRDYSVEILKIYPKGRSDGRNLLIRITDPALLETTGGIVQGMSGSPILQNGKLVGAVTHVLVNDPTKGYGIFIENMLDAAG